MCWNVLKRWNFVRIAMEIQMLHFCKFYEAGNQLLKIRQNYWLIDYWKCSKFFKQDFYESKAAEKQDSVFE